MQKEKQLVPQLRFPEFESDWKFDKIGNIGYFYYGKSAPKWSVTEDAKTPCIRYGELYSKFNEIITEVFSHTNIEPKSLKFSKGGEILVPRVGEKPLEFANCSHLTLSNVAIGEMISVYNTDEDSLFFTYCFNATCRKSFAKVVEGANVSNLYFRYLENIEVSFPSIEEQQKIANFITTVSEHIQTLEQKKTLLEQYKKGVLQKIFKQELRFKDENGKAFPEWEEMKLSDFLIVTLREVVKPKENYLAIGIRSHCKGTFQKPNADPSKNSMDKLYVVKENDLIVNITFAWEGAIAIVKKEDEGGHVSHRFPTYTFDRDLAIHDFFKYVIIQKRFRNTLDLISPGGAGRNRVMSKKEFLKIKLNIPCVEEQIKIANFLSAIDKNIALVNTKIEHTKAYKKGLLQQLFV